MCGTPGQPACYSRPVIFDVDENAKTAQIEWQDIRSEFSPIIGSIQELPNGDMFFDLGDITPPITAIGRIVEETKDSPPQVVWQLEEATGQIVYRAVHLPSLYPGVQW